MKINLIVLTKEKLLSIDTIIPILLELKSRYPQINIIFFFPSKSNCEFVKKNVHLWACIESLNAQILAPQRENRILILCFLIRLFIQLMFCKNIIIKFGDTLFKQKQFFKYLRYVSKTIVIQALILIPVIDFQKNLASIWSLRPKSKKKPQYIFGKIFNEDSEYLLTSLSMNDLKRYYQDDITDENYIYTGYTRRLPKWEEFVDKAALSYLPIQNKKYFLYILTTMGLRTNFLNEPLMSDLVKETLTLLKQFNPDIQTIFKPHPITDLKVLHEIIEEVGYSNYLIDYGHPSILSSKAEFVIGNTFSNTMYDAFYNKIPIIEYSSYDRKLLKLMGNGSRGGKCCDFFIDRNPLALKEIVLSLLKGGRTVIRDRSFLDTNFPKTPNLFWDIFDDFMKS